MRTIESRSVENQGRSVNEKGTFGKNNTHRSVLVYTSSPTLGPHWTLMIKSSGFDRYIETSSDFRICRGVLGTAGTFLDFLTCLVTWSLPRFWVSDLHISVSSFSIVQHDSASGVRL